MNRRAFISSVAVAIPVVVSDCRVFDVGGAGMPDDWAMLQGMLDRGDPITGGVYHIGKTLTLRRGSQILNSDFYGESGFAAFFIPTDAQDVLIRHCIVSGCMAE